jgi:hypothetical protein
MVNGEFYVREGNIMMYAEEDMVADVRRLLAFAPAEEQARPVAPSIVTEPSASGETDGEGSQFEEGFKIVRRPQSQRTAGPILPLHPTAPTHQELPPDVRRVFGEDDV